MKNQALSGQIQNEFERRSSPSRAGSCATWRRSYDVEDPRAQVSTIFWEPTPNNANALRFFDTFAKTVTRYAGHVRETGKQLPISMNARAVLDALLGFMDGKTGRCDPCLDTIAKRCHLSRRTVVRQLHILRDQQIINWVRRTMKTGNAPGEGPKLQQTSNAYFIDMLKLPIEIMRTLRQKLGTSLREVNKHREGSGAVPNRLASKAQRMVKALCGAFSTGGKEEHLHRQALAHGHHDDRLAQMYGDDLDAMREHQRMLDHSNQSSASANLALYPPSRTEREVDRGR